MFFKVTYKREMHVINLETKTPTLKDLNKAIQTAFSSKLPRKYILTYLDAEGDEIALGSEGDMGILIEAGQKITKIKV